MCGSWCLHTYSYRNACFPAYMSRPDFKPVTNLKTGQPFLKPVGQFLNGKHVCNNL